LKESSPLIFCNLYALDILLEMLITSWNCANGIVHKMDEVRLIIDKYIPEVLFVCEAEVRPDQIDLINIRGYNLELSDSLKLGKSRLIAYVREGNLKRKLNLEGDSENIIVIENAKQRLIGIYRGFKNYRQPGFDALGYLFGLLNEGCKTAKEITIIGDFNIDPTRDLSTPQGQKLESLIIDNGLFQMVNFVTRSRPVQRPTGWGLEESTIDLILTNVCDNKKVYSETTTSDHRLIAVDIEDEKRVPITKKQIIRDWTQLIPRNVARLASGAPDPTTLTELSDSFEYLLDKLAPLRVVRTRLPDNLVNPRVEKIKKKRDRLYRTYKLTNDNHFLSKVKEENKKLKRMISKETKRVFQKKA